MKILGFVPARMAASRFPGKPLHPILGRPMLEHCFLRASKFKNWTALYICTCDREIEDVARSNKWPVIMTSDHHKRALDRVAEAAERCGLELAPDDIVLNVQGDEPLIKPEMIQATIQPLVDDKSVRGTMLAMHIIHEDQWRNPDTVKIIHDIQGDVLYTSRSPVPYTKKFGPGLMARRIYGIFGFRWEFLKLFTSLPESPLERAESCDSNRILDNGLKQRIAPYPFEPCYSVDSPDDIHIVESAMNSDALWGTY